MNKKALHAEQHPGEFFLDPDDRPALAAYLASTGRVDADERVLEAAKAGEGNMNCVVRVRTDAGRSFILKQARDWVEKYPGIPAPRDRVLVEDRFYTLTARTPAVAGAMPRRLWCDAEARLLALEDLGEARDFFPLYAGGAGGNAADLAHATFDALVDYLSALHAIALPRAGAGEELLANRSMRTLNHEHIFALPLRPANGLDLDGITPGLAGVAAELAGDERYVGAVRQLGERYLSDDGRALIHGDFFPGSWLCTEAGAVRVIDPEFCFRGDPEFDVGVMLAHLRLTNGSAELTERLFSRYRPATDADFSPTLAGQFAGVEIMRRLLGVAQLPLGGAVDLARKRALLAESRRLVLAPERA